MPLKDHALHASERTTTPTPTTATTKVTFYVLCFVRAMCANISHYTHACEQMECTRTHKCMASGLTCMRERAPSNDTAEYTTFEIVCRVSGGCRTHSTHCHIKPGTLARTPARPHTWMQAGVRVCACVMEQSLLQLGAVLWGVAAAGQHICT